MGRLKIALSSTTTGTQLKVLLGMSLNPRLCNVDLFGPNSAKTHYSDNDYKCVLSARWILSRNVVSGCAGVYNTRIYRWVDQTPLASFAVVFVVGQEFSPMLAGLECSESMLSSRRQ
jgi:hypothetical protein